jgi:hypothetical protein
LRKRSRAKPSSAYAMRMSPYQRKTAWMAPISSRMARRREWWRPMLRPRASARCICTANPRPNRNENVVMALPLMKKAMNRNAMLSAEKLQTSAL